MTDRYILYSGGAIGTDTLFGTNAEWYGITEQNYSFRHHKNCRSRGRVILDEVQLKQADGDLLAVIGKAFREHHGTGDSAEKYWQRNWYQIQKVREIFVVSKDLKAFLDFTKARIEGAAIGVALAIKTKEECKRVCIYDQTVEKWYVWKRKSGSTGMEVTFKRIDINTSQEVEEKFYFEEVLEDELRIIETDFAGIGTREMSSKAIDAINGLFKRSFSG